MCSKVSHRTLNSWLYYLVIPVKFLVSKYPKLSYTVFKETSLF